jgi:hypothetical protein
MKALFLTILLCTSCTKYAKVSADSMGIHIDQVDMNISHTKEIQWRVGKRKEEIVSQSFIFVVDLPKIKQDDLDILLKQRGIDSWIVRLIMMKGSERHDLGSLYTLFRPQKISRGVQTTASTSASIKVYYAAAYASERFRTMKCPPFNHNKRIDNMDVRGDHTPFSISIEGATAYQEKSQLIELTPSSFNGGQSLIGEYFVEIAPYDSVNKMIYSAFKRIPRYIDIGSEDQIEIKSCAGVHEENQ